MRRAYKTIVKVPIGEIIPYWNNPRLNERTREALVDAYGKIGFNQPILIDAKNVIIKGHARYHAARIAGYRALPCIVSRATKEENREDRILDNQIEDLSGWDPGVCEAELRKIDLEIKHVLSLEEITEGLDLAIPEEPKVVLQCPQCGKGYRLNKSDVLRGPVHAEGN